MDELQPTKLWKEDPPRLFYCLNEQCTIVLYDPGPLNEPCQICCSRGVLVFDLSFRLANMQDEARLREEAEAKRAAETPSAEGS